MKLIECAIGVIYSQHSRKGGYGSDKKGSMNEVGVGVGVGSTREALKERADFHERESLKEVWKGYTAQCYEDNLFASKRFLKG